LLRDGCSAVHSNRGANRRVGARHSVWAVVPVLNTIINHETARHLLGRLAVFFFLSLMREAIVKNHYPRILRLLRVTSLLAISAAGGFAYAQKLTPAEVVAKHLDSVGSTKARAAVTTRIIAGTSQVIFRTEPSGQAIGRA